MGNRPLKQLLVIIIASFAFGISISVLVRRHATPTQTIANWKLYWFVPDGLRADPSVFNVFDWAEKGLLPNIKKMMEQGSYGYSIPVFPSHTPINFATLFTGTKPARHGVADGPIHVHDYPLAIIPRSGFSSIAKMIDPFWYTLEQAGHIVTLLSVPGSTPPEITQGHVIKGRWGGWGMEFPNLNFHAHADKSLRNSIGWNDKVFQVEKKLTEFIKTKDASGWKIEPKSFSDLREINLRNWDADLFALLLDSTDDQTENYDQALFSSDKKTVLFTLKEGQWSDWFNLNLSYSVQRNYQDSAPQKLELEQKLATIQFATAARVKVIKLGAKDMFRIRVLYDGLNESVSVPSTLAESLRKDAGPMVDFVDNFPPQLVYFPEDKQAFQDEMDMSFEWHAKAQKYFFEKAEQDVFIHSIYSPNQMLTSRWWMGFLDPRGRHYSSVSEVDRDKLWSEVKEMYQKIDAMVGEALKARPKDAYVVFGSDHGALPLNFEVRLNNLFADKGWLFVDKDVRTGALKINWQKTRVIFLNMAHVYIHPQGLHGDYRPAKGPDYERLRSEVLETLKQMKDEKGVRPLADAKLRESVHEWGLPSDRVGDIVIAAQSGYSWVEDVDEEGAVFTSSMKSGYKQAVLPDQEQGLWTPFIIVGPGVRHNHRLTRPISHTEQYPTIMKLLKVEPPYRPDAGPLEEIFSQ